MQPPSREGSWELVPTAAEDPRFDSHGFRRDPARLDHVLAMELSYELHLSRQSVHWGHAGEGGGKQLRDLARGGIPASLRRTVWPRALGANELQASSPPHYFDSLLAPSAGESELATERQISLDLERTFPGHAMLSQSHGQESLRAVLTAFSRHSPHIGYVQGLGMLAALFLVVLEAAEPAFWCLVGLTQNKLPANFYDSTLSGCRIELAALQELVEERLPQIASHFRLHGVRVEVFAARWFVGLFASSLPSETALRVWDMLVVEGARILHGVALALLAVLENRLLQSHDQSLLLCMIQEGQVRCCSFLPADLPIATNSLLSR